MARFTYHGPVQSISLAVGSIKNKDGQEVSDFKDVDLVPGKDVPDLPEDNPIVAAMIELELLRPATTKSTKSTNKPAKPGAATQGEK